MLKTSSKDWEFDVYVFGDDTSTSVETDMSASPLSISFAGGPLPVGVNFVDVFVHDTDGAPETGLWAVPTLSGTVLTLSFKDGNGDRTLSNNARFIFRCQAVW